MLLDEYIVSEPFKINDSDTKIFPTPSFRSFPMGTPVFEFEKAECMIIRQEYLINLKRSNNAIR